MAAEEDRMDDFIQKDFFKGFTYREKCMFLERNHECVVSRPANSHGFAVCLTVLASISRSHEFVFISHGFSKTYFQFTNAAIFKMFRFYLAFPLQILCMILCKISLFCVIVLESTALLTSLVGLE